MNPWVNWRGVVLSGLLAGLLFFAFYGQDIWMGALGIGDIPGAELYVLALLILVGLGVVWSEPLASVAAGVGGMVGLLVAANVTGRHEDYFPAGGGFDSIAASVSFLVIPAGAHVLGAAFAQVIRRPAAAEAEPSGVMP